MLIHSYRQWERYLAYYIHSTDSIIDLKRWYYYSSRSATIST